MKVTCQRDGLLTACQLVSAAVAARTTKPILSNVKATAQDDGLTLVAYDTEVGTRYALSGGLWEAEGKTARLVATDSKRLAVCEGPATIYGPPETTKGSHLVPAKTMGLLERNLTDDGELVRVGLRPNEALFQTER